VFAAWLELAGDPSGSPAACPWPPRRCSGWSSSRFCGLTTSSRSSG
jgi:hypothetical protein